MGKECFTCKNKESKELTETEIKKIKADNIANNKPYERIPELIFTCKATGNRIKQTDPACSKYNPDDFMIDIRRDISKTARKLRRELR